LPLVSKEFTGSKKSPKYNMPDDYHHHHHVKPGHIINVGDNYEDDENMEKVVYDNRGQIKEQYDYTKRMNENYHNEPEIPELEHNLPSTSGDKFKQSTLQILRAKYNREKQIEAVDNSKLFNALTDLQSYTNKP